MKLLQSLKKHLLPGITLAMIAGFSFGTLVHTGLISFQISRLKVLILPLTFLMIYPMMINFQPKNLLKKGGNKALTLALVLNFLVGPFIAFGIGKLLLPDQPILIAGLLLITLLPTSGMTISWTGFAKGNITAAVKMTITGLILGALLTPFFLWLLLGQSIDIDTLSIARTILLTVFTPMLVGALTRIILVKTYGEETYKQKWLPNFPGLSSLGVILIMFVAIALKTETLLKNPALLLQILVPIILLYGINLIVSVLVGKTFLDRPDSVSLIYGTITKNLSIALAIAINSFGSETALLIAIAYIIQVQVAAGYMKFSNRVGNAQLADSAT